MVFIRRNTAKIFSIIYPVYLTVMSAQPFSVYMPEEGFKKIAYSSVGVNSVKTTEKNNENINMDIVEMQNLSEMFYEEEILNVWNETNYDTEEYIGTFDMSHYTNETGSHVPKYEGGATDRRGNPLIAYDSIAIPKSLFSSLPYGTRVKLVTPNNEVYYGTAVDTGSALNRLNRIDRCVASYKEADRLGVIKGVKLYKIN